DVYKRQSKNCALCIFADVEIWLAGDVSVPLYPNLTSESDAQVLEHSEAALVLVGKLEDWASMAGGVRPGLPTVPLPICPTSDIDFNWSELQACAPIQDNP
ncbi:AMP-binding protein, partial [Pseudomonas sp. RTC3]|nr:AMP-binding protein [Pseudomonas sp. RTC3]